MRSTLAPVFAIAMAAASVAGCGDNGTPDGSDGFDVTGGCDKETRNDVYSINMSKAGPAGYEVVLIESTPAPPAKGDNSWQVQILDPSGVPLDDLTLTISPFMPDHGHGTPVVAEVTPEGADGRYTITPVNMWMPGLWRIRVQIEDDTTALDTVEYFFCIEG
jgi:hypothetical protein